MWYLDDVLTGTLTLRNMLTPFMASLRAISCGVEIMTAPLADLVLIPKNQMNDLRKIKYRQV